MGSVQKEQVVTEDKLVETPTPTTDQQPPDTPGNDENKDGLPGGATTADQHGDVLGI